MATMDLTLPVASSTVFQRPTGEAGGEASAGFGAGTACADAESANAMGEDDEKQNPGSEETRGGEWHDLGLSAWN